MAVSFLKKMQYPPEQATSLTYLLHKHYRRFEPARSYENVHASELSRPEGLCPRMYALHDVTKQNLGGQWLSTSESLTYQMGRDQERNTVMAFAAMGKAVCHWRCKLCLHIHDFQKRPEACEKCGCEDCNDPIEVRFKSSKNGASCGIDMLVDMGGPKLRAVELKTMAADQFKTLVAPLAEHRLRTTFYLRLLSEADNQAWAKQVDWSEATILYVSKSAYGCANAALPGLGITEKFSPFREYPVKRDDASVQYLADRAKVVHDYRAGKVGMPAGVCPTALVPRAVKCAFKGACFSGDHPATYDWSKPNA